MIYQSDAHRSSPPATILCISDGEPTDRNPERNAGVLRSLGTDNGSTQVHSVHVTSSAELTQREPTTGAALLGDCTQLLFRISNTYPKHSRQYTAEA